MKIGFIGAGKVGFSLGKYFADNGITLSGYYSRNKENAIEAAEFTASRAYDHLSDLVNESDALFLTVSDGAIPQVWEQLKELQVNGKIVCHCSGALSSKIFSGMTEGKVYGYSVHPLFAVSSKYDSYKELSKCYFTIEGATEYLEQMKTLFTDMGNPVAVIDTEQKVKYHAAAAISSNLVVGLVAMSEQMLVECGFDAADAHQALIPIIQGNMQHIVSEGTVEALTGPMERNDVETVKKHLACLKGNEKEVYRTVSKEVLKVAKKRHVDVDYRGMEEELQ
ncbi:MAG: Rossmann-like and DUF2520 domain-containing protein [Roseburia sp.]